MFIPVSFECKYFVFFIQNWRTISHCFVYYVLALADVQSSSVYQCVIVTTNMKNGHYYEPHSFPHQIHLTVHSLTYNEMDWDKGRANSLYLYFHLLRVTGGWDRPQWINTISFCWQLTNYPNCPGDPRQVKAIDSLRPDSHFLMSDCRLIAAPIHFQWESCGLSDMD